MLLAPKAFLLGLLRAFTSVKSVLLLWLTNLLLGVVVATPIHRLAGEVLAQGSGADAFLQRFDAEFIADLQANHGPTFRAAAAAAGVAALVYVLVHAFLMGGVLWSLAEPARRVTFAGFFAGCGRHLFPFVRVLLPAGVMVVLLAFANDLASRATTWFFNDVLDHGASAAALGFTLAGKTTLFLALLVLLVVGPVQLARVRCAVEGDRFMTRAYLKGIGFCLRNPLTMLLYFVLSGLLLIALYAAHDLLLRRIDWSAPLHPFAALGTGFDPAVPVWLVYGLLGQATIVLALVAVVQRAAGLVHIHRERTEPPAPPDPELRYATVPDAAAPPLREPVGTLHRPATFRTAGPRNGGAR